VTEARYTSNQFFHFVGRNNPSADEANYETLKKILNARCVSHRPHENDWGQVGYTINWERSIKGEELIVPTVTCYADIPFESLGIHVKKYGKFGLSFSRDLLIQYGARPVMYVPTRRDDWQSIHGTTLLQDVEAAYKGVNDHLVSKSPKPRGESTRYLGSKPANEADAINLMASVFAKDFLAFIKPFNSQLDSDHPNNFYMEREWRKFGNLKFTPIDVMKVLVAEGYSSELESDYTEYVGKVIAI
jgi:hypothetical protein